MVAYFLPTNEKYAQNNPKASVGVTYVKRLKLKLVNIPAYTAVKRGINEAFLFMTCRYEIPLRHPKKKTQMSAPILPKSSINPLKMVKIFEDVNPTSIGR